MKRHLALSATAALMAGLLVGCSGDEGGGSQGTDEPAAAGSSTGGSTGDYCEALQTAEEDFERLDGSDAEQFEQAFETFSSLAEQAPEEVSAEWETLDGAVTRIEDALAGAGLEFSDLEGLSAGETPEGVTPQELQQLGQEFQSLAAPEVSEATQAITEHAQQECDIELGLFGGGAGEAPSDEAPSGETPSDGATE